MQATDTSAIQRLIARARRRIRQQGAIDGATTAAIVAAPAALAAVYFLRLGALSPRAGIACLAGAALLLVLGAVIGAARRLDDERVARRIDRASGLADRLSTAIAFTATAAPDDDETRELMRAAIDDGVRAVPRANLVAATPFSPPRDLWAAVAFVAVSALTAGLAFRGGDADGPRLVRVEPDHVRPGGTVKLHGAHLGTVRGQAVVFLGGDRQRFAVLTDWTDAQITVRIPDDALVGDTTIAAAIATKDGERVAGPLPLTVVPLDDKTYQDPASVALDPDERQYVESLLAQMKAVAKQDKVPELEDYAKTVEQLLKDADQGKLTKEQLLDALGKAEDKLNKDPEPLPKEIEKQLAQVGQELAKSQETKDLGQALATHDIGKAKQELEKLAQKLDDKQLTDQQKQELGKKLDDAAKQLDKQDKQQQDKQQQQEQKIQDEVRRLEKKEKEAKSEQERQDTERRLQQKKDELKKLEKDQQEKDQSAQRDAVKRLQKDMEQAAENLQKKPDPKGSQEDKDQQQQEQDKQASQKLKDAARETGKVDQDQRKQAAQKKMSSQMDDLREAMQRAKQKGNKGPQDPFNKDAKNQDFAQRAKGGKGNSQSWKPGQQGKGGQGQQQGQGQGKQGQGQQGQGQGSGQGGQEWGTGHDDNLTDDATAKSGNTKDDSLQGQQGTNGGGTRETILAAAQKGFASAKYQKVYESYQQHIEEVMRAEKVPASYKHFVNRYFAKIHPSMSEAPTAPEQIQK